MKIMQITFFPIINSAGGGEKVFCGYANLFSQQHEVFNVCCDTKEGVPFYSLNNNVEFKNIGENKNLRGTYYVRIKNEIARILKQIGIRIEFPREKYVRSLVHNELKSYIDSISPDVIICYCQRSMVAVVETGFPVEKIIAMFHTSSKKILKSLDYKQKNILKQVKVVQVLLPSDRIEMENHGYYNVVCIGNIVPQYDNSKISYSNRLIIHVGRLDKGPKRQHLLIEAFATIADKYPDWQLKFWGGGSNPKNYEEKLKELIEKYNIGERVFLMGTTNNIPDELVKASIFAFPSAYEGFSLALTEAMSIGLPSVGFRSSPSINELIKDGYTGILCDDGVIALAKALDTLMGNEELRYKYGMQAHLDMLEYSSDNIYRKWSEILHNFLNHRV